MTFYMSATILIELLMIAMTLHVINYSGFTRQQKAWFIMTFASVMVCSAAEFAVHCGYYKPSWAIPLTIITVIQFSASPLLAVFFSGALGQHKESKRAVRFFMINAVIEIVSAPFGWVFYFDAEGYHRGKFFIIYTVCYFLALLYLIVSMIVVGRKFRHRDTITIGMVLVILIAGIIPMTLMEIHIAYISIGIAACLCYIYYNDLVQEDIHAELIANQEKITDMQKHTISGLANLIESRDTETGEHVSRTGAYVKAIAENAMIERIYPEEIDERFISLLTTLAPMHDVGKIIVPDSILRKPGKLTDEEYEIMKTHASAGGDVVRQILKGITDEEYLKFASDIATYHHERWDGAGYPEGLAGEDIPISARIMAIADVFDALVSERCYKKAMPVDKALATIRLESGSHFDPKLAEIFLKYYPFSKEEAD
ncbi:MAG: HD domain-containing protein [Clostridia bacterium]|nr:HD domain-containing protein [Clostridia bacterium]